MKNKKLQGKIIIQRKLLLISERELLLKRLAINKELRTIQRELNGIDNIIIQEN